MESITNISDLIPNNVEQMELLPTLFSFTVCILMGFVIRAFYIRRSFSLTGKTHVGSVLPILSAVVFLVIMVVKSSLALSLGLVGALSIVRFRTPIKEPEELVYLFLAIAVGLGYGAGHILLTTLLTTIILFVIWFWLSNRSVGKTNEYNLVVHWQNPDLSFGSISDEVSKFASSLKLVRLECNKANNTAVMLVSPEDDVSPDGLVAALKSIDPEISSTFFEAKTNW